MGKLMERYMADYTKAIAPGRAAGHKYIVRPEVWIASKWTIDQEVTPWMPEFRTKLQALLTEDPELFDAVAEGLGLMADMAKEADKDPK